MGLTELRCALLSSAAPLWATLHPIELCCTSNICCIQLSYAVPYLASLYLKSYAAPSELRWTLWAMLQPSELRYRLLSYVTPYWAMPQSKWAIRDTAPVKIISPIHRRRSFADPSDKINDIQRKPAKYSSLAKSTVHCALCAYIFLWLGLNNEKSIHTLPLRSVSFLSLHL
jgi:hypothetical protein